MVGFRETPSTLVARLCRVRLCSGMKKIHECLRKGFRMEADMMWASRSGKASVWSLGSGKTMGRALSAHWMEQWKKEDKDIPWAT